MWNSTCEGIIRIKDRVSRALLDTLQFIRGKPKVSGLVLYKSNEDQPLIL